MKNEYFVSNKNYAKYFDRAMPLGKRCLHENFTLQAKNEPILLRNGLKPN